MPSASVSPSSLHGQRRLKAGQGHSSADVPDGMDKGHLRHNLLPNKQGAGHHGQGHVAGVVTPQADPTRPGPSKKHSLAGCPVCARRGQGVQRHGRDAGHLQERGQHIVARFGDARRRRCSHASTSIARSQRSEQQDGAGGDGGVVQLPEMGPSGPRRRVVCHSSCSHAQQAEAVLPRLDAVSPGKNAVGKQEERGGGGHVGQALTQAPVRHARGLVVHHQAAQASMPGRAGRVAGPDCERGVSTGKESALSTLLPPHNSQAQAHPCLEWPAPALPGREATGCTRGAALWRACVGGGGPAASGTLCPTWRAGLPTHEGSRPRVGAGELDTRFTTARSHATVSDQFALPFTRYVARARCKHACMHPTRQLAAISCRRRHPCPSVPLLAPSPPCPPSRAAAPPSSRTAASAPPPPPPPPPPLAPAPPRRP